MKHVIICKGGLKIKAAALLAACGMIALSAAITARADEFITDEVCTAVSESEESRKLLFTDPDLSIYHPEIVETETVQEPEQAEPEVYLGEEIAAFAYSFVGWLPYEWGGESLEYGADCCGFTQAVYEAFGIWIPRTVEEQAYTGYSVSLEEALPGDIVIYYGHVGLYAGEGMVIHAPYPGAYVSCDSVYDQEIRDIRRII